MGRQSRIRSVPGADSRADGHTSCQGRFPRRPEAATYTRRAGYCGPAALLSAGQGRRLSSPAWLRRLALAKNQNSAHVANFFTDQIRPSDQIDFCAVIG